MMRCASPAVLAVLRVEEVEVHLLDTVGNEPCQVVLTKPVRKRRWEQVELVSLRGDEVVGRRPIVPIAPVQVADLTRAPPGSMQIAAEVCATGSGLVFWCRLWCYVDMAFIVGKKQDGNTYYYLAESARADGKPRIVFQRYLGSGEEIAARLSESGPGEPDRSRHLAFGDVAAVWEMLGRLRLAEIADEVVGARRGDAAGSVGT